MTEQEAIGKIFVAKVNNPNSIPIKTGKRIVYKGNDQVQICTLSDEPWEGQIWSASPYKQTDLWGIEAAKTEGNLKQYIQQLTDLQQEKISIEQAKQALAAEKKAFLD